MGTFSHRTRDRVIVMTFVAALAALIVWYPAGSGPEPPSLVQRATTVLSTSFSMPRAYPGYYAAYPFEVPAESLNAELEVNFTVSTGGGPSFSVEAYVMDPAQLATYQSGGDASSVVAMATGNSLSAPGLTLDIGVPGTYYVVFTPFGPTGSGQPATIRTLATLDYTGCTEAC